MGDEWDTLLEDDFREFPDFFCQNRRHEFYLQRPLLPRFLERWSACTGDVRHYMNKTQESLRKLVGLASDCEGDLTRSGPSQCSPSLETSDLSGGGGGVLSTHFKATLKAYIPLRRKTICVGYFCVTHKKYNNMLVYYALGDANLSRHPTQNPNASQWNIGCVEYQTQNFRVGHVHSCVLC